MSAIRKKKILIIRFSSFGDIVFALSTVPLLNKHFGADTQIDWLLRSDMKSILQEQPHINKIFPFERHDGLIGLCRLAWRLRLENYDIIYDAHNNMRSFVVRFILGLFKRPIVVVRSKERLKRFLLFKLRKNIFDWPYKGMESFLKPLTESLGVCGPLERMDWPNINHHEIDKEAIVLVPGTAWPMKTWPQNYWKELINLLPAHKFIILGGPHDDFCHDIAQTAPERAKCMAGQLTLFESCEIVSQARFVITGDTGLAQVADLTGRPGITMIGPTAFGYPSLGMMNVAQVNLACSPCTKDGRGNCSQSVYQQCMVDLTPEKISMLATSMIKNLP
jgi:ADP-heptose:LPS heptosyltransferase